MFRDPSLVPLSHQHQHGLALSVMIDRGLKAEPTPAKAAELSRKVAALAEAELLGHFQVEEEVLFPTVRPALESGKVVDELISQHRTIEEIIDRLAQPGDHARIALLKEFAELLSRHIRIEERQLFQEVQAKLPPKELGKLGIEIDRKVQKTCPVTSSLPWEHK